MAISAIESGAPPAPAAENVPGEWMMRSCIWKVAGDWPAKFVGVTARHSGSS